MRLADAAFVVFAAAFGGTLTSAAVARADPNNDVAATNTTAHPHPPAADGAEASGRAAAQAALADGNRLFKNGEYDKALEAYRRAQALYPSAAAKVEFNIGKVEQALGHAELAAEAFERFLAQPLEAPPEYRDEAATTLVRISSGLGRVRVVGKDGVTVVVDGTRRGSTPLGGELWLRIGQHMVAFEESGRSVAERQIEVRVGDVAEVRIDPPEIAPSPLAVVPAPAAAAASTENVVRAPVLGGTAAPVDTMHANDRPIWKRWWFWAAVAGTAVAAGTLAAVMTSSHASPVSCPPPYDMNCQLTRVPDPNR